MTRILHTDHFNARPMLRWSSVRDCSRKAVYEATHAPARERYDREERILFRGRSLGREYASFLAQKYGAQNVLTEVKVEWPLGVGHMDVYLVPTRTAVEVLSSAHASEQMIHSKLLQLTGYMEHASMPVDSGALVILNPSDFTDEILPVAKTSKTYAGLVEEMHDRIAQVQAWADTGTIPDRTCQKPSEARGHFCLYAEHCFEGWEAPAPAAVFDDDEAREYTAAYYRAKQDETAAKQTYDSLVTYRKEVEELVAAMFDTAGLAGQKVKARSGPLELAQIVVGDHQELSLKKARLAGVWTDAHDELFQDFLAMRGGHTRYQVDRVSDEPVEDFGAEAPWTADDLGGEAA
jgi:hypothetical protein